MFTNLPPDANSSPAASVDSSGNLKDASEIVFYNPESDEVPLPCPTGSTSTGEHTACTN